MLPNDTPYADLTPDLVLDAIEAFGHRVDGRLLQLNSYENRVFQVGLDDGGFVVTKFYRPGRWSNDQILEEHAFTQDLVLAEVPAVAPLPLIPSAADGAEVMGAHHSLGSYRGHRLAIAPRKGGRAPELEDPQVLTWLGRFLARMHTVGAEKPFGHRLRLDVSTHGWQVRDWLREHHILPPDQAHHWLAAADQALSLTQEAFDRIPDLQYRRVHGDCHPGNVLWTPDGPHFVDLDDACMAPAVQDFWMLLSGNEADRREQLNALLDGYEAVSEFDWRELRLIEPLRTLRILHHSAWLARRWADPAFPAAFPWFGTGHYWQQQTDLLRQQIELLQAPIEQPIWLQ